MSKNKIPLSSNEEQLLDNFHKLMIEALRQREKDIIQFVAILVSVLLGFGWLLKIDKGSSIFTYGSLGMFLVLEIGASYSLALGYNYRYLTMQIAKLEAILNISDKMLAGWARTPERFRQKYGRYCYPPEIIQVFWISFLLLHLAIYIISWIESSGSLVIIIFGAILFLPGVCLPYYYGEKIKKLLKNIDDQWNEHKLEIEEINTMSKIVSNKAIAIATIIQAIATVSLIFIYFLQTTIMQDTLSIMQEELHLAQKPLLKMNLHPNPKKASSSGYIPTEEGGERWQLQYFLINIGEKPAYNIKYWHKTSTDSTLEKIDASTFQDRFADDLLFPDEYFFCGFDDLLRQTWIDRNKENIATYRHFAISYTDDYGKKYEFYAIWRIDYEMGQPLSFSQICNRPVILD